MTEKELKKLNRYQLLEIIIMQTEEIENLRLQLEQTKAQLEKRQIQASSAGNIAQAALAISGVFEAAQAAADIYLEAVKEYAGKTDEIVLPDQTKTENVKENTKADAILKIIEEARKTAEQVKK